MKNREAGVVLEGGCDESAKFHKHVFDSDWSKGTPFNVTNTYSEEEMKKITDPSPYPVEMPDPRVIPEAYISEVTTMEDVNVKKIYTSPDFARDEIMDKLENTKVSLDVSIYEVRK